MYPMAHIYTYTNVIVKLELIKVLYIKGGAAGVDDKDVLHGVFSFMPASCPGPGRR